MADLPNELLVAARSRIGSPFRNHYEQPTLCGGSLSRPECMRRGMNASGYDCSGFVIACMCDVLGMSTSRWPPGFRHLVQIAQKVVVKDNADIGDIELMYERPRGQRGMLHMGIVAADDVVIHASSAARKVTEGQVNAMPYREYIAPDALAGITGHARRQ